MIHLAGELRQADSSVRRAAEHAVGRGLSLAHQTLFKLPFLTGENSLHRGVLVSVSNERRPLKVTDVERQDPVVVNGATVVLDRFEVTFDSAEGTAPEKVTLLVNRDGYVTEGDYAGSRLASPAIVMDNLWGLRPFEILQLKFAPLAYGVSNVFNQISGWTAWHLNPRRVAGLFGPGWYENAAKEYVIQEPDFADRACVAMQKEMMQLARILAYRFGRANGQPTPAAVVAQEQKYLRIAGTVKTLKDQIDHSSDLLEQQVLQRMQKLREALDALDPVVVPFLAQMRDEVDGMVRNGNNDGVDVFQAMGYAAASLRLGRPENNGFIEEFVRSIADPALRQEMLALARERDREPFMDLLEAFSDELPPGAQEVLDRLRQQPQAGLEEDQKPLQGLRRTAFATQSRQLLGDKSQLPPAPPVPPVVQEPPVETPPPPQPAEQIKQTAAARLWLQRVQRIAGKEGPLPTLAQVLDQLSTLAGRGKWQDLSNEQRTHLIRAAFPMIHLPAVSAPPDSSPVTESSGTAQQLRQLEAENKALEMKLQAERVVHTAEQGVAQRQGELALRLQQELLMVQEQLQAAETALEQAEQRHLQELKEATGLSRQRAEAAWDTQRSQLNEQITRLRRQVDRLKTVRHDKQQQLSQTISGPVSVKFSGSVQATEHIPGAVQQSLTVGSIGGQSVEYSVGRDVPPVSVAAPEAAIVSPPVSAQDSGSVTAVAAGDPSARASMTAAAPRVSQDESESYSIGRDVPVKEAHGPETAVITPAAAEEFSGNVQASGPVSGMVQEPFIVASQGESADYLVSQGQEQLQAAQTALDQAAQRHREQMQIRNLTGLARQRAEAGWSMERQALEARVARLQRQVDRLTEASRGRRQQLAKYEAEIADLRNQLRTLSTPGGADTAGVTAKISFWHRSISNGVGDAAFEEAMHGLDPATLLGLIREECPELLDEAPLQTGMEENEGQNAPANNDGSLALVREGLRRIRKDILLQRAKAVPTAVPTEFSGSIQASGPVSGMVQEPFTAASVGGESVGYSVGRDVPVKEAHGAEAATITPAASAEFSGSVQAPGDAAVWHRFQVAPETGLSASYSIADLPAEEGKLIISPSASAGVSGGVTAAASGDSPAKASMTAAVRGVSQDGSESYSIGRDVLGKEVHGPEAAVIKPATSTEFSGSVQAPGDAAVWHRFQVTPATGLATAYDLARGIHAPTHIPQDMTEVSKRLVISRQVSPEFVGTATAAGDANAQGSLTAAAHGPELPIPDVPAIGQLADALRKSEQERLQLAAQVVDLERRVAALQGQQPPKPESPPVPPAPAPTPAPALAPAVQDIPMDPATGRFGWVIEGKIVGSYRVDAVVLSDPARKRQKNQPFLGNQDASTLEPLGDALVIAVSDGMSERSFGGEAARYAAVRVPQLLAESIQQKMERLAERIETSRGKGKKDLAKDLESLLAEVRKIVDRGELPLQEYGVIALTLAYEEVHLDLYYLDFDETLTEGQDEDERKISYGQAVTTTAGGFLLGDWFFYAKRGLGDSRTYLIRNGIAVLLNECTDGGFEDVRLQPQYQSDIYRDLSQEQRLQVSADVRHWTPRYKGQGGLNGALGMPAIEGGRRLDLHRETTEGGQNKRLELVGRIRIRDGDVILVASDSVTNVIPDEAISAVVARAGVPLRQRVEDLVRFVAKTAEPAQMQAIQELLAGKWDERSQTYLGHDHTTALVVEFHKLPQSAAAEVAQPAVVAAPTAATPSPIAAPAPSASASEPLQLTVDPSEVVLPDEKRVIQGRQKVIGTLGRYRFHAVLRRELGHFDQNPPARQEDNGSLVVLDPKTAAGVVISDGMGGAQAGDFVSEKATELLQAHLTASDPITALRAEYQRARVPQRSQIAGKIAEQLRLEFNGVQKELFEAIAQKLGRRGCDAGATGVVGLFLEDHAVFAGVADSSAWVFDGTSINPILPISNVRWMLSTADWKNKHPGQTPTLRDIADTMWKREKAANTPFSPLGWPEEGDRDKPSDLTVSTAVIELKPGQVYLVGSDGALEVPEPVASERVCAYYRGRPEEMLEAYMRLAVHYKDAPLPQELLDQLPELTKFGGRRLDGDNRILAVVSVEEAGLEEQPEKESATPSATAAQELGRFAQALETGKPAPQQYAALTAALDTLTVPDSTQGISTETAMAARNLQGELKRSTFGPASDAIRGVQAVAASAQEPTVFLAEGQPAITLGALLVSAVPVAFLSATSAQASGLDELLRASGVPEGQYAVVGLEEFGGDREAAVRALAQRFPAGSHFAPIPAMTGLEEVEKFLRGHRILVYSDLEAGMEEVDRHLRTLA